MTTPSLDDSPRSRRWNAHWIWAAGGGKAKNAFYYFPAKLDLNGPVAGAKLFITAETRYQLYLNGQYVGRGSLQSHPFFKYYDERGVSGFLVEGTDCIAAIANCVGNQADTRDGPLAELVDGEGNTLAAMSCYQEWGMNGSWRSGTYSGFLRTHSHARSARPAELLIRDLMGLEILEPGCRTVRLAPRQAPFDYAVAYLTPLGPITAAKRGDEVSTSVPRGVTAVGPGAPP